jgi:hypothetical protein
MLDKFEQKLTLSFTFPNLKATLPRQMQATILLFLFVRIWELYVFSVGGGHAEVICDKNDR